MSRYRTLFLQRRARLVCGWVTMTNRRLSHMQNSKVPRRVTYCPMNDSMNFVKGHGKLNILCFWTGHDVGWHDATPHDGAPPAHGTTSVQYIHYYISLNWISYLKIQFPTISHTKSTTSPNRFQNHNVAGALPYVPILGTSGSLANMQPTTKNDHFRL